MVPVDFRFLPDLNRKHTAWLLCARLGKASFAASQRIASHRAAGLRVAPFSAPLGVVSPRSARSLVSQRVAALGIASGIVATSLFAAPVDVAARSQCSVSATQRRPPAVIRVKMRSGHIRRVPFRHYVEQVMAREWGHVPTELQRAGAIAVKQYGWNRALHPHRSHRSGRCFDVFSSTRDQLFKPRAHPTPRAIYAVRSTWHTTLRQRDGRLVFTGYRTGERGLSCGRDSGNRLYARSAQRCAVHRGWSGERIVRYYYRHRHVHID